MNYVLDACIGIKWVLPEADSDKALLIRDDYKNQVIQLIAPDSFPAEVTHALTRAERKGLITPQEGARNFIQLMTTLPQIYPSLTLLPRAYELSSQFRIGVFDCLYVALAEREQCQCVTADQRMLTLFPGTTISLEDLSAV
jgi:predicted nucleic acid-binding protein